MILSSLSRRGVGLLGVLVALLVAGCAPAAESEPDVESPGAEGFPVSIDTAYGRITLDHQPERIVALGRQSNYADMLAALGKRPVAVAIEGAPDQRALLTGYPWLEGLATGDLDPAMITTEQKASPEAIAAHRPELILGDIWNIDPQLYEQLSQIAPTYVGLEDKTATAWKDHLNALGTMTGTAEESDRVVAQIEADLTAARDRLAGLQGKTYNFGVVVNDGFQFGGATFPDDLGLTPAENQTGPTGTKREAVALENLDQLQADVLLIGVFADPDARTKLEDDPRFAELPAVRNGTVVFVDRQMANAAGSTPGPSSLAWLLGRVVPPLADSELNRDGR